MYGVTNRDQLALQCKERHLAATIGVHGSNILHDSEFYEKCTNCVFSGQFLWNPRTSEFGQQGPKLRDGWKTERLLGYRPMLAMSPEV